MEHVLIIDDDLMTIKMLRFFLSSEGYEVTNVHEPSHALALLESNSYDLVILEAALREMDGVELCRKIRAASTIPIIFISTRTNVKDRVEGLLAGADDYIVKPFEPSEVLARMWSILRRSRRTPSSQSVLDNSDFKLNLVENRVVLARTGETVELTGTEARLLHTLVSNPGRTISREALVIRVWGYEYDSFSNQQLQVYMYRLRSKIEEDPSRPELLITVRGAGYKYQPGAGISSKRENIRGEEQEKSE